VAGVRASAQELASQVARQDLVLPAPRKAECSASHGQFRSA